MTNRCLCLSSNIVPWWRNNTLSIKHTKIYDKNLPISIQKKYIEQMQYVREPIISVQEQRQTREPIPIGIKCKSNYTVRTKNYFKRDCLKINHLFNM
jgi:hypothetical protein